jgi:uncharacterized membrane protein
MWTQCVFRPPERATEINVKAELEIELLHEKIDILKEQELLALSQAVRDLTEQVRLMAVRLPKVS